MKTKLFNITVYAMLGWSIVSAVYVALPVEYQAMIPQFNWLTAVVSGGSTLLLGSGGLAVQAWLSKARTTSDAKYNLLAEKFLTLTQKYDEIKTAYTQVVASVNENNKLLKIDLNTKLSNPLIDETARNMIEQVLGYVKQE